MRKLAHKKKSDRKVKDGNYYPNAFLPWNPEMSEEEYIEKAKIHLMPVYP